jgi:hypothetical protein
MQPMLPCILGIVKNRFDCESGFRRIKLAFDLIVAVIAVIIAVVIVIPILAFWLAIVFVVVVIIDFVAEIRLFVALRSLLLFLFV